VNHDEDKRLVWDLGFGACLRATPWQILAMIVHSVDKKNQCKVLHPHHKKNQCKVLHPHQVQEMLVHHVECAVHDQFWSIVRRLARDKGLLDAFAKLLQSTSDDAVLSAAAGGLYNLVSAPDRDKLESLGVVDILRKVPISKHIDVRLGIKGKK